MKKIIMSIVIMLILAISVMAGSRQATPGAALLYMQQQKAAQEKANSDYANVLHKAEVKGLENAMLRVQSEDQKLLLEKVLAKIEAKKQEQINKLEGLIVEPNGDNVLIASGKEEKFFLSLIPMKKTTKFKISVNGDVDQEANIIDGLFADKSIFSQ